MVNLSGWAINELPKWIVFVSWKVQSNGAALSVNTSKGGGVLFCDCLAFFPSGSVDGYQYCTVHIPIQPLSIVRPVLLHETAHTGMFSSAIGQLCCLHVALLERTTSRMKRHFGPRKSASEKFHYKYHFSVQFKRVHILCSRLFIDSGRKHW